MCPLPWCSEESAEKTGIRNFGIYNSLTSAFDNVTNLFAHQNKLFDS